MKSSSLFWPNIGPCQISLLHLSCCTFPEYISSKGFSLWCLVRVEKVTSWVTASLMLHEFSNGRLAEMVLDRKTHSDKQTFSSHLLGHRGPLSAVTLWPITALFLYPVSSWAWGNSVTVSGARTSWKPEVTQGNFHLFLTCPIVSLLWHVCCFLSVSVTCCLFPFFFFLSFLLSQCHPEMTQPLEGPILFHCFRVWHFTIDVCSEYALAVSVKADKHSAVAMLHWGDSCLPYRMYFCRLCVL